MSLRTPSLLALALAACGPKAPEQGDGTTGTGASSTGTTGTTAHVVMTTSATTTASSTTTTTTSATTAAVTTMGDAGSSTTTGVPFIMNPDGGVGTKECEHWAETCPKGQKCMPVSLDGDYSYESLKCVPLDPDPAGLGEACMAFGDGLSGLDTCGAHAMCWNLAPDTLTGTCIGMCLGEPGNLSCADPNAWCIVAAENILAICFPQCDPLAQDCESGDGCYADGPGFFFCGPDSSGDAGQAFSDCSEAFECDPNLHCAAPDLAAECDPMSSGCCLPLCDLAAPNKLPGQDQQCIPFYDELTYAAPMNLDVGLCSLP